MRPRCAVSQLGRGTLTGRAVCCRSHPHAIRPRPLTRPRSRVDTWPVDADATHYPLEVLNRYTPWRLSEGRLAEGDVLLAVARNGPDPATSVWEPSNERARVLHRLEHQSGIEVKDWGDIDTEPREVSELWLHLIDAGIPAFAAIASAWITVRWARTRSSKDSRATDGQSEKAPSAGDSVAGFSLTKPNGASLVMTMKQDMSPEERADLIQRFLSGS